MLQARICCKACREFSFRPSKQVPRAMQTMFWTGMVSPSRCVRMLAQKSLASMSASSAAISCSSAVGYCIVAIAWRRGCPGSLALRQFFAKGFLEVSRGCMLYVGLLPCGA
jgi:hypothetical protein